ncbi:hypothetical protein LTS18_014991 [Coniosporium uncinatum]|uniref:Uncharacterized protein n=1 Tax=Coniosporium uncinatum TaxID=93489 RepID=A0ACC3DV05_9PEZI|nr:hypothetical protein LTS18_014991 [Coniosporium uncinatum]
MRSSAVLSPILSTLAALSAAAPVSQPALGSGLSNVGSIMNNGDDSANNAGNLPGSGNLNNDANANGVGAGSNDGNGNSVNLSKRQRNVGSVIGNLDGRGNNLGNEVAGGNGVHNEKFV